MSSRARRRARKLLLGLKAYAQYLRASQRAALTETCDTLYIAHMARRRALVRRYGVGVMWRRYLAYVNQMAAICRDGKVSFWRQYYERNN